MLTSSLARGPDQPALLEQAFSLMGSGEILKYRLLEQWAAGELQAL